MRFIHAVLAICLLLAAPVDLSAASASKEFPNDACGAVANLPDLGNVGARLKWKDGSGRNTPTILESNNSYAACTTGDEVAADMSLRLCLDCIAPGAGCSVSGTSSNGACPFPCVGAVCCTPDCNTIGFTSDFFFDGTNTGRIALHRGGVGISAQDSGPGATWSQLVNLHHSTNAGNTVGTDFLRHFVMSLERRPGAVDGTVIVTIDRGQPPPAETFSFNTTDAQGQPLSDDGILTALQAGFAGRSIASTKVRGQALLAVTAASESYHASALSVNVPANVLKVYVKAPRGFMYESDTSTIVGPPTSTPALTTWGVAALIGLMLLAGAWILRRTTTMRVNLS